MQDKDGAVISFSLALLLIDFHIVLRQQPLALISATRVQHKVEK
jgi:hypothetical protein